MSDETSKPELFMMDKDNVVAMINSYANVLAELHKNIPDLKLFPADKAGHEAVLDRDNRKETLRRLGITPETKDDYRLVRYRAGAQEVMFVGHMEGKRFVADRRLVIGGKADSEMRFLPQIVTRPFTDLPAGRRIVIPIHDTVTQKYYGEAEATHIKLSPQEAKKLATDVTLIALADQAGRDAMAAGGSPGSLPITASVQTGRTTSF
jgi:hypothetical protein